MPVVKIDLLEGHSKAQKAKLMELLFRAFEESGIPREWVTIVMSDLPEENWAVQGETMKKILESEKKQK